MNFGELLTWNSAPNWEDAGDDPKDPNPFAKEMRVLFNRKFKYDNKTPKDVITSVAKKTGVNPYLLFSSSFQEGMNKALAKPDENENYLKSKGWFNEQFPVSGYDVYGLDTFGGRFDEFVKKGYLPAEFKDRFTPIDIENDHMKSVKDPVTGKISRVPDPQLVKSADFKSHEDALMAKAAYLRSATDSVKNYAAKKGITLDENAANYFTLAAYNSGEGNAFKMLDKYKLSSDKKSFIEKGDPSWQRVHVNVAPRMQNMIVAQELLNQQ